MKGKKGVTDEGGVRSPLFIRWPGKIQAGSTITRIAGAIDLLPTLTALGGRETREHQAAHGWGFLDLLLGGEWKRGPREIMNYNGGKLSVRSETHRLYASGVLFDMVVDPNQTKDITAEQPQIAAELAAKAMALHQEVFGKADVPAAGVKGKGKAKSKNPAEPFADDRPDPAAMPSSHHPRWKPAMAIPAWRGEVQLTMCLTAHSELEDQGRFNDLDIDVHTAGDYKVSIDYACPEADAGATVQLSFDGAKTAGKCPPAGFRAC